MNDSDSAKGQHGPPLGSQTGLHVARFKHADSVMDVTHRVDDLLGFARSAPPDIPVQNLAELAGRIYRARQIRASFLNNSLLGEPVWDMLLTLYCQRARGEPLSVSGLCYSAGVPPTTALRWLHLLEHKKLIDRTPDASDARRAYLTLSDHGLAVMSAYLATIYAKLGGPVSDNSVVARA